MSSWALPLAVDEPQARRRQTAFASLRCLHLPPLPGLSKPESEIWTDGSALDSSSPSSLTREEQLCNYFLHRQTRLSLSNHHHRQHPPQEAASQPSHPGRTCSFLRQTRECPHPLPFQQLSFIPSEHTSPQTTSFIRHSAEGWGRGGWERREVSVCHVLRESNHTERFREFPADADSGVRMGFMVWVSVPGSP